MVMPSGWSSMSDADRASFLFAAPEWQADSLLAEEPKTVADRLRVLIEQKWTGLSDNERIDLLIEGPQWMREGIRARLAPENAERLEGVANRRWVSMPEEEKIQRLAGARLAGAREDILAARERDPAQRVRLLEIANERADGRVRAGIEAWQLEHPCRAYSTAADHRSGPSARIVSDFWRGYDDDVPLSCFDCDWAGRTADGSKDLHDELFHVSCPQCGQMLLVVSYPTLEQTRLAADGGNAAAQAELERLEHDMEDADRATAEGDELLPDESTPCRAKGAGYGTAGPDATTAQLQKRLNEFGHQIVVDGKYGVWTEAAVKAFQQKRGLPASGESDAMTLRQMFPEQKATGEPTTESPHNESVGARRQSGWVMR
jgi:hypothetical protein